MKVGFETDKGIRRLKNEDSVKILSGDSFFMLADGVGGNRSGEVASSCALDALEKYVSENHLSDADDKETIFRNFLDAVNFVNQYIKAVADTDEDYEGMASTLVFAYIRDNTLYAANVGDSRLYVTSEGRLYQITEDHTYVNDLVKLGAITREEASRHNKKNVITRAMGVSGYIRPDCFCVNLSDDARVLICSDGLYDEVSEERILRTLYEYSDMQACAESLVNQANENGGNDNISVICISLED